MSHAATWQRIDLSAERSLALATATYLRSEDVRQVEYALYAIYGLCLLAPPPEEDAAAWVHAQPAVKMFGRSIAARDARVKASRQLQARCAELGQSAAELEPLRREARRRVTALDTPTRRLAKLLQVRDRSDADNRNLDSAVSQALSEPGLGYLVGFALKFADRIEVNALLPQGIKADQDDLYLLRTAVFSQALCDLGEDCRAGSLFFLSSCARLGACDGHDTVSAFEKLFEATGVSRDQLRQRRDEISGSMLRGDTAILGGPIR